MSRSTALSRSFRGTHYVIGGFGKGGLGKGGSQRATWGAYAFGVQYRRSASMVFSLSLAPLSQERGLFDRASVHTTSVTDSTRLLSGNTWPITLARG